MTGRRAGTRPITEFKGAWNFLSSFEVISAVADRDFPSIRYSTIENAYQAAKSLDEITRLTISRYTPGQAKRAGRGIPLRSDWDADDGKVKVGYMWYYLGLKFHVNGRLTEYLIQTHPRILVEGNWWHDNYWGSCSCTRCGQRGKNMLGKLLMKLRQERIDAL
jgi:ribA/ribD-fused uncharacterized protein